MKFPKLLVFLVVSLMISNFSWAEEAVQANADIQIANGSSSGIYAQITKEIKQVCGDQISISEVKDTSGAIENLDRMLSNDANAAFLHSDVLSYRGKTEDLSNIKTLLALFPEDIHFLAMNKPYEIVQGPFGMQKKTYNIESISDLGGLAVGAAGGGFISSNVIRLQAEIPYTVIQFNSGKEVIQALNDGKIAAGVFVGPAPLPNLKDLGKEYKLLNITDTTIDKLKSVYKKSTVMYTKMSPLAVQTVAADDLLITRDYKSKKHIEALTKLRACVQNSLNEESTSGPVLKETIGFHKAWQKVDINNRGKWDWYSPDSK